MTGPQQSGDAFAAAHARLLADRSIQFALPPAPRYEPPAWLKPLGALLRHAWPTIRIGVWVMLGLMLLWLLWQIAPRLLALRWRRTADEETGLAEAEWRPDAAPARELLADADRLAAEGRYAEAARLVLLRSVEDIARRRPGVVRPATTSRDLAATPEIPLRARPAFAAIAGVVETALFADRDATAEAWTRARDAYSDFALAGNWR